VRRNTELFRQAMQMFTPFAAPAPAPAPTAPARKADNKDIDELKEQLKALQTRLDSMGT